MRGYFPCPEEGKNKLWIRSGCNTHSVMFCTLRVTGRMKYFCYRFSSQSSGDFLYAAQGATLLSYRFRREQY